MQLRKWLSKKTSKTTHKRPKSSTPAPEEMYVIDFNMMLKGSVYKRRSGNVRQFGVTVDGATRLVTSGERVDRATYDALLDVGAIREAAIEFEAAASEMQEKREKNEHKKKSKQKHAVGP